MHLEKARGPTALPTGWIANRQSSPWHFAKFTKPVHTCISRLRDLTENTDYKTWTSTLKSLHLHLVLTAVVCTASGRSLSLRALLISSGFQCFGMLQENILKKSFNCSEVPSRAMESRREPQLTFAGCRPERGSPPLLPLNCKGKSIKPSTGDSHITKSSLEELIIPTIFWSTFNLRATFNHTQRQTPYRLQSASLYTRALNNHNKYVPHLRRQTANPLLLHTKEETEYITAASNHHRFTGQKRSVKILILPESAVKDNLSLTFVFCLWKDCHVKMIWLCLMILFQLSCSQLKFVAPKFICQDFQCGRI
ncbi:hypothetical protein Anapl_08742 [Anas platyrhynchos]|uniref:Uncharacterized protein n=1 Tax=Anas platyrhynchos TaxID=8839 RepID=R0LFB3_ANAPL|nr:hypothetical protein Anapl_08742 [Anas platyrhynchos]